MPLQRSPNTSPVQGSSSEISQDNSTNKHVKPNQSGSNRPSKRKQGDDMEFFMEKIETMFNKWTSENDKKTIHLQKTMNEIHEQNQQIKISIEFISEKYEQMKEKIENLEIEKKNDRMIIQNLEQKIEFLDKISRIACLELRNIPINKNETSDDLKQIVKNLGDTIKYPISYTDIRNVYRAFSKIDTKRHIIIEFGTVSMKEKMLVAYKTFNRVNSNNNLSLSHLKIEGHPTRIYLSEYLTPKMKRLYFVVRDFASTNDYRFCWATAGTVYLKKKEGDQPIRIKNEMDLKHLQSTIK